jgi:hypothetical protein
MASMHPPLDRETWLAAIAVVERHGGKAAEAATRHALEGGDPSERGRRARIALAVCELQRVERSTGEPIS